MSRRAELAAAFGLLTRLPSGWIATSGDRADPRKSVWAYPLVGAVVGATGGLAYWLVHTIGAPPLVAGVFALAAIVLMTGGMHEDGTADTADGLGGGADRARKLEIMRDSRIGTYGVIALILVFALRIGVVATLAAPLMVFVALIASAALSRGAMVLHMYLIPHARTDGLAVHVGRPGSTATLEALAITALGVLVFLPFGTAIMAIVGTALGSAAVGFFARAQIGGQTGDVLGAAGIAAECAALTAIVAVSAPG